MLFGYTILLCLVLVTAVLAVFSFEIAQVDSYKAGLFDKSVCFITFLLIVLTLSLGVSEIFYEEGYKQGQIDAVEGNVQYRKTTEEVTRWQKYPESYLN